MASAEAISKGLLSVEVKAPTIVAGTPATINLIIQNPFLEIVVIESIQAPTAAPLLPERKHPAANSGPPSTSQGENNGTRPAWFELLDKFRVQQIKFGPLVAEFPEEKKSADINISLAPQSKLLVKTPFPSTSTVNIKASEGGEVVYDANMAQKTAAANPVPEQRLIAPQQQDIASFEIKTAHWLLVKPKVLELHTLIRYRIGDQQRSQVVPLTLSIQPPVKAIVVGSISGSVLGYLARVLNSGFDIQTALPINILISWLGVVVMAAILAIVLSRHESSKGFVTLEDFYGAFVVGAILGYVGTGYFESVMKGLRQG